MSIHIKRLSTSLSVLVLVLSLTHTPAQDESHVQPLAAPLLSRDTPLNFISDGYLDLAGGVCDNCGTDGYVLVGRVTAEGISRDLIYYCASFTPSVVVDADGNLDLLSANGSPYRPDPATPPTWSVLLGNGDGTFQAARNSILPSSSQDINDILADGYTLAMFHGMGGGSFADPIMWPNSVLIYPAV